MLLNLLVLATLMETTVYSHNCLPGQEVKYNATTGKASCLDCTSDSFSKDGRKCFLCTICQPGQIEISKCRRNRNSICQCSSGTYLKGEYMCTRCSTCPPGTYQTLDCSHNKDRSCRKCPKGLTTNITNGRVCTPVIKPHRSKIVIRRQDMSVNWWIPLIPGVFVVLTGICAAVFYWRSRRKKNSQQEIAKRNVYDLESYPEQVLFVSDEPEIL